MLAKIDPASAVSANWKAMAGGMKRGLISVLAGVTLWTIGTSANADQSLIGAWRLVSWIVTSPSGEVAYPYGRTPHGQLVYTSDGQMSAQLMNPDLVASERDGLTAEEAIDLMVSAYFAYYGSYSVDASSQIVTHHVVGSLTPSWIGTDQIRASEFLDDNRIEIGALVANDDALAAAGADGSNVLVWERMR